jgi:hypothetical protein
MFFLFCDPSFPSPSSPHPLPLSSHISVIVISPLDKVSGPLGSSHMWLHELLELTKTYSFPINLSQDNTQQLQIPSMGLPKVLREVGSAPVSCSLWVPKNHWPLIPMSCALLSVILPNLPLISQKFALRKGKAHKTQNSENDG